eukprot:scaffold2979_cov405-Prasinococcus_capsulatus_cf.AAC.13
MVSRKKSSNPTDTFRKEQRKKELMKVRSCSRARVLPLLSTSNVGLLPFARTKPTGRRQGNTYFSTRTPKN